MYGLNRSSLVGLVVAFISVSVPTAATTQARTLSNTATVIRLAFLAPEASQVGELLAKWSQDVTKRTQGRVKLRNFFDGREGDDFAMLQKMRARQLDGSWLLSGALFDVSKPAVLMLSMPGVNTSREQFGRAERAFERSLAATMEEAGFVPLAWTWAGANRIFSSKPFRSPSDLPKLRPWVWERDPILIRYFQAAGARPVAGVPIPEVYPEMAQGNIDAFVSTSAAAVALQWSTKVRYVSKDVVNASMGALVLRKEIFDTLSTKDQKVVMETARATAKQLTDIIERVDRRAYEAMLKRGILQVDFEPTRAQWDALASETRESLANDALGKSMLRQVEQIDLGRSLRSK